VLSMLGVIAVTTAWVVAAVRLFDRETFFEEGMSLLYMAHVAFVVVGAWFLWHWWHELLRPDVHRGRDDEDDAPPQPHLGLSGRVDPPTRW
jgi:ABC-type nickel/cobalt efflux system permease component RcnA